MRDAGFVRGNGPPTPEVITRIKELAKERGIELPAGRFGGGDSNAPVTRTLYTLTRTESEPPRVDGVTVKLGITDGTYTEILEGLKEGDQVITSAIIPGAKPGAPATNPFSGGQQRRF